MTRKERIVYLGNVAHVAGADSEVSPKEGEAIEQVRKEMGIPEEDLARALQAVGQGRHSVAPVGRFSDRIRNLEDMVFVAVCDNRFSGDEKPEIVGFAKQVGVSQAQLNEILKEARQRSAPGASGGVCSSCGKTFPAGSKFCPGCGRDLRDGAA